MAVSKITMYSTKLLPEKNAKVDDIEYYLNHLGTRLVYNECQYQKLELEMTIKVEMQQRYHFGSKGYNYLALRQDSKNYYFFIVGSKWKASNTVELALSMDTINTFVDDLVFSENTHITRQHTDRFVRNRTTVTNNIVSTFRKVDKEDEGIQPPKRFISKEKIYNDTIYSATQKKAKWYLIYRTSSSLSPTNTDNPISCYCCSDYKFILQYGNQGIRYNDFSAGTNIVITNSDNRDITVEYTTPNGDTIRLNNTSECKGFNLYFNGSSIRVTAVGTNTVVTADTRRIFVQNIRARITEKVYTSTVPDALTWLTETSLFGKYQTIQLHLNTIQPLRTISEVNRSDTRLIKILELPYSPFDVLFEDVEQDYIQIPDGWSVQDEMFLLDDLSTEFKSRIQRMYVGSLLNFSFNKSEIRLDKLNDKLFESKLFNSAFNSFVYKYDSSEKEIQYEYIDSSKAGITDLWFKPTNTINSNFLFHFEDTNDGYQELTDNSEYLVIRRTNDLPIYSSSYIEYVNNGYNYDKKNVGLQIGQNAFGIGTNVAGALAQRFTRGTEAFGRSSAISLAVTAISQVGNAIFSAINNERAIQQKLQELKNSPSSVNGSDDLDLFDYTCGNKMEKIHNKVSEPVENAVYNYLRLLGYACDKYAIPDTDSRTWFNFVQCEPTFINEDSVQLPRDCLDDIKAKYQVGVTYYHRNDNGYDLDQMKENYEIWLFML